MRAVGALLGTVLALMAGGLAHGQVVDSRSALFGAAFARQPAKSLAFPAAAAPLSSTPSPSFVDSPGEPAPAAHAIAFSQPAYLTAADEGAVNFADRPPLSLTGGGYEFAIVPQGGVGAAGGPSSAQAGAMVRVGADVQDKVMTGLNKLGMHTVSSASIENRSRLYLFAAYSGREVGFNIGRGAQGGVQRLGWSAEGASTLVSDAQAGFGWRKGELQASVGYVHRDVNSSSDNGFGNVGMQKLSDNMVAFTFSLHGR
jgi:hypothetical protein